MGQANRRGNLEQRIAQAKIRKLREREAKEKKRQILRQQEDSAYDNMVWWQRDMTEQRYERIVRRQTETQLALAQLLGMVYGAGWR